MSDQGNCPLMHGANTDTRRGPSALLNTRLVRLLWVQNQATATLN